MATDDDTLTRPRPRSTLLGGIGRTSPARPPEPPAAPGPEEDDFALLPQPGSAYDAAHSRAANKPVPTLTFLFASGEKLGLPYANLDSIHLVTDGTPGASPVLILRYTGLPPREARLTGRNQAALYDLIAEHRIRWVRELPRGRDFRPETETVITSIAIVPIKEMPD